MVEVPEERRVDTPMSDRPAVESKPADESRSTMRLLREFSNDLVRLVRQEIDLAKTEMSEKASKAGRNVISAAVGAFVAFLGVVALLIAAIAGLAVALANVMAWYHAIWVSALIVGIVVAIIGYALIQKAISTFKRMEFKPRKTIETLREDKQWLKHQVAT